MKFLDDFFWTRDKVKEWDSELKSDQKKNERKYKESQCFFCRKQAENIITIQHKNSFHTQRISFHLSCLRFILTDYEIKDPVMYHVSREIVKRLETAKQIKEQEINLEDKEIEDRLELIKRLDTLFPKEESCEK